jgi:hypothetical protein
MRDLLDEIYFILRPCMLIPIVGELMTAIGLIFCTYFEKLPMEVAGVTEALFPGLAGKKIKTSNKLLGKLFKFFRWLVYDADGGFQLYC